VQAARCGRRRREAFASKIPLTGGIFVNRIKRTKSI